MGNLIIKPNTGGLLKLQEDGGTDAIAINTSGGVSGAAIKDEDNMSSNSATHLATQQSIKAYVDSAATTATTAAQGVGTGDSPTFAGFGGTAGQITAKAFATVSFISTTATDLASYNVSSVTDGTTGKFTLNFASALSSTTYTSVGMGGYNSNSDITVVQPRNVAAPGTTTCNFEVLTAGSLTDAPYAGVVIF